MKEENAFVIFALLFVSTIALIITGFIVYNKGPNEPLNSLIMIVNSAVSGMIGYLTKGVLGKNKDK